jgi:hypothetical protein
MMSFDAVFADQNRNEKSMRQFGAARRTKYPPALGLSRL